MALSKETVAGIADYVRIALDDDGRMRVRSTPIP